MNWRAQLLWWLLKVAAIIPLSGLRFVAALLVPVALRLPWRERKVSEINLTRCLPEKSAQERAILLRESLYHVFCSALELPKLWTASVPTLLSYVEHIDGEEHLRAALATGRGVLIAAPHLGAWELLNLYLAEKREIGILYRAPRSAWIEDVFNRARGRSHAVPIRAEASAVRSILKRLNAGGMVGILPDQKPKLGEGELAPIFGIRALTMTLFSKLAIKPDTQVLFAFAIRTQHGFQIVIRQPSPAVIDPSTLNANVEACARMALAQYQWSYKRYPMRAEGEQGGAKFYQ